MAPPAKPATVASWPPLDPVVGPAWGGVLLFLLGFRLPPGPETTGQWAALVLVCFFLGLVHAGAVALFGAVRDRLDGRLRTWVAMPGAAAFALFYTALGLSAIKFLAVRSHLRASDLRFVLPSLAQVFSEATAAERRLVLFSTALPVVLFVLFLLAGRRTGRGDPGARLRFALVALVAGAAGLAALAATRVDARFVLTTLTPEGAIATRWIERLRSPGSVGGTAPLRRAAAEPRAEATPEPWNLVVLMLESVPWKRTLGPEARPESTPRLVELARDSVVFDRAYAASVHSDYAQTAILSALYPRKGDQHDFFVDLAYPRALPWDVLAPFGRRSAVFSTQNERWGNMEAFLRTPALDTFRHAPDFRTDERHGGGAQTKVFERDVVPAFLDWVAAEPGTPFVAYLNFQATHFPYSWPAEFEPPFGAPAVPEGATFLAYPPSGVAAMLDRFHNALAYQDLWLGRLVDGLGALGAWERTVLVVVGDHGEAFREHGLVTHGTAFHDEQVRVPLVVRLPGGAPRRVAATVSVLDALPSVYRAMGVPVPPSAQGRDDLLAGTPLPERAAPFTLQGMTNADGLVAGGWKWFRNPELGVVRLFDLASDPGERRDLSAAAPEVVARLTALHDRFLRGQVAFYRTEAWRDGWFAPALP